VLSFVKHHTAEILLAAAETVRAEVGDEPELEDAKFFYMTELSGGKNCSQFRLC